MLQQGGALSLSPISRCIRVGIDQRGATLDDASLQTLCHSMTYH